MTEQETLQDILIAQKFLLSMYNQFGLECSNLPLRKLLIEQYTEISHNNFKIFEIMQNEGFYPVTPADIQQVNEAISMHTQMHEDLTSKIE